MHYQSIPATPLCPILPDIAEALGNYTAATRNENLAIAPPRRSSNPDHLGIAEPLARLC
ncbi:hypothetical protein [Paraburkholderia sp. 40]|uniref:hypothetical protein n=1 Tax=Paraburkholderia sp. 40 TaxID=2991059 RepID=UPI003D1C520F